MGLEVGTKVGTEMYHQLDNHVSAVWYHVGLDLHRMMV